MTLLQPERDNDQMPPALPPALVPELPLMLMVEQPMDLPVRRLPLHEATLFIRLPNLAKLPPDQVLVWRDVLRWELEILSEAYQALDPELEGLDWISELAD